ncbi:MAG TPA: TolC family protein [Terracidiphilus sp.]|nr:TolC family protein [Terracidiphilus sp.]
MSIRFHFSSPSARTLVIACVATLTIHAQAQNPSSASNPYWGSVTVQPVTDETLRLSLDDAVRRGFQNNLGLKEAENNELFLKGEKNEALQQFLPTIKFTADTGFYQHNLAAQGFSASEVSKFTGLFPNGQPPAGLSFITKDDLTDATLHYDQTLFSGPVIAGYKAAGAASRSAYFARMTARGQVVQDVATTYLRCIADASEVENAKSQVSEAQVLLNHEHLAHLAGTAANLDELRAKVQLQAQQQALIAAQNKLDKELILLKREIGIPPAQKIELTDPAPYSELAAQTQEEALATAYKSRQDYQNLQNQAVEYKAIHAAYRSQRLPTLKFSSYYQTSTVNGAGTHGNFMAFGTLSFPIFREAGLRGDEDASLAEKKSVDYQLADLRVHIDQQVRSAMLDVNANAKLVDVGRSNVDLAARELSDETDRVNAGVDDNLPLVTAQASLAAAQTQLVESLYQYNVSKVALARACGVLETEYRDYLGR